jgi:hypothetical protein
VGKISIPAAFAASLGFIEPAWRRATAALLILVAFSAAIQILNLLGETKSPLIGILILVIQAFVGTMATAALYRMAIAPDHSSDPDFQPGPGGVQWGGLEWRVLGANIIVGLIFAAILFVVIIVWVIGLSVLIANHSIDPNEFQGYAGASGPEAMALVAKFLTGPAGLVTFLTLLPAIAVCFYLGARLSLYAVRAADARSFDMGKAWSMTHGATGAILVALVAYFIASGAVGLAFGWVGGLLGKAMHATPGIANPRLWTSVLATLVTSALGTPFVAGLVTFVYRNRNGGGSSVADQFS